VNGTAPGMLRGVEGAGSVVISTSTWHPRTRVHSPGMMGVKTWLPTLGIVCHCDSEIMINVGPISVWDVDESDTRRITRDDSHPQWLHGKGDLAIVF